MSEEKTVSRETGFSARPRRKEIAPRTRAIWSPEAEAELRQRRLDDGQKVPAIARAMGRTKSSIKNRLHVLGIAVQERRKPFQDPAEPRPGDAASGDEPA